MTVDPGKAPREGTPYGLEAELVAAGQALMEAVQRLTAERDELREALRWIALGRTGSYGSVTEFACAVLEDEKKPPRRAATAEEEGRHQTPRPPDPTGSA